MWRSIFALSLIACTPGQARESGSDVISDYEWNQVQRTLSSKMVKCIALLGRPMGLLRTLT